jgi:predicted enzyme related to lactoylglutathione lyase
VAGATELPMTVLINIDVPDLHSAVAFYTRAFGLTVKRRFGEEVVELAGWPAACFLLQKEAGSMGAGNDRRSYARHWTPVHLDVVVEDIDKALAKAVEAGAALEQGPRIAVWGKLAVLADPFGHGLCLIEFLNRGYDEIADP